MRTVLLALALAALTLAPVAASMPPNPAILLVYRAQEESTFLAWSVVTDAHHYVVYRGDSLQTMEVIGLSEQPYFLDEAAPTGTVYYGVTASDGALESDMIWSTSESAKGGCVTAGPGGKLTVSVQNCVNY